MAMEVEMNMMGVPTRANCTNEIGYPYLFFHQISYVFLGRERRRDRERERRKKREERRERREGILFCKSNTNQVRSGTDDGSVTSKTSAEGKRVNKRTKGQLQCFVGSQFDDDWDLFITCYFSLSLSLPFTSFALTLILIISFLVAYHCSGVGYTVDDGGDDGRDPHDDHDGCNEPRLLWHLFDPVRNILSFSNKTNNTK